MKRSPAARTLSSTKRRCHRAAIATTIGIRHRITGRIPGACLGRPYVRRDGRRVPGTRLYEPLSDNYDRTRLQRLFDDSVRARAGLALHGRHPLCRARRPAGAYLVSRAHETAMNPHLEYAQVRWGHNGNKGSGRGIIEMKDLYYFLDGVRLLEHGAFLSNADQQALCGMVHAVPGLAADKSTGTWRARGKQQSRHLLRSAGCCDRRVSG
jgi:hypothetical protein